MRRKRLVLPKEMTFVLPTEKIVMRNEFVRNWTRLPDHRLLIGMPAVRFGDDPLTIICTRCSRMHGHGFRPESAGDYLDRAGSVASHCCRRVHRHDGTVGASATLLASV